MSSLIVSEKYKKKKKKIKILSAAVVISTQRVMIFMTVSSIASLVSTSLLAVEGSNPAHIFLKI